MLPVLSADAGDASDARARLLQHQLDQAQSRALQRGESPEHRRELDRARIALESLRIRDPHHPDLPILERRLDSIGRLPALTAERIEDSPPIGRPPPRRLGRTPPGFVPLAPVLAPMPPPPPAIASLPADLDTGIAYRLQLIDAALTAAEAARVADPDGARAHLDRAASEFETLDAVYGLRVPGDHPMVEATRERLRALEGDFAESADGLS